MSGPQTVCVEEASALLVRTAQLTAVTLMDHLVGFAFGPQKPGLARVFPLLGHNLHTKGLQLHYLPPPPPAMNGCIMCRRLSIDGRLTVVLDSRI